jgi:hypothetical protein
MDRFEDLLTILERWAACGERRLPDGTKLICPTPHVGSLAWLHELFGPVGPEAISKAEARCGCIFPEDLRQFFTLSNGLSLFSGRISIYGIRRNYARTGDDRWQPFDIADHNEYSDRPDNCSNSILFFASLNRGTDRCFFEDWDDGHRVGQTSRKEFAPTRYWPDFWTWLFTEVQWLERLFDPQGRLIVDPGEAKLGSQMSSGQSINLERQFVAEATGAGSLELAEDFLELRASAPFDTVSLGSRSVILLGINELEVMQVGYSVAPDGTSLTGNAEGDWKQQWLVIGYEDLCGDPFFIDTDGPGYPVYTAMHGQGSWAPCLAAVSFKSFLRALGYVKDISAGRENPVERESNPIPRQDSEALLKLIADENPRADLEFWELWVNEPN